jgi:anaerobic dimethyl sulfoxide reductase subunit B (iron-sulfur subunit)
MACKDRNDLEMGTKFRKVIDYAGGTWETKGNVEVPSGVFSYSVSVACNHCASPACVAQCPTGAMTKDEETGIVTSDPEVCIGCGTCVQACPYGEPRLVGETPHSGKCDMCYDLVSQGGNPRCVDACIMRCLKFGDIEELRSQYGENASAGPLPDASETNPSLVIIPHRNDPDVTLEGEVVSSPEEIA